jgi:hypothetical protein
MSTREAGRKAKYSINDLRNVTQLGHTSKSERREMWRDGARKTDSIGIN